ncbi:MAG: M20 family metallopeptidase [Candidatus Aenigmarchaeota archaeon]|nr:M20 family metallopeptidase [Candidatus Aenigmarchaeota archaeon]
MDLPSLIRRREAAILRLARDLIQTPTEEGNETATAQVVRDAVAAEGIRCILFGKDKQRQNLLFSVGEGRTLLFNGHLDTVPAGDPAAWRHPPFAGVVRGGILYGRGASDMKGGVAAIVHAALALRGRLQGRVVVALTRGEEGGEFDGARELLARGLRAAGAIVADGSLRQLTLGCRGGMRVRITVHGRAAHTGTLRHEGRGRHAVLGMARLLLALEGLQLRAPRDRWFPPPKITPGTVIKGGVAVNVVPERCEAMVDCRLVPGQTVAGVLQEIRRALPPLPGMRVSLQVTEHYPPVFTPPSSPLVQAVRRAAREELGRAPPLGVSGGGTDANVFQPAGIPCVVVGTRGDNYHAANEWVRISSLSQLAAICSTAAVEFLNAAQPIRTPATKRRT